MNSDLSAIRDFTSGKKTSIEYRARRESSEIWETRGFRSNNSHSKLLAIILAHHQPIDLLTGQKIDTSKALAWNNSKEFHHFFPQDYLKSRDVDPRNINVLANIIILSSGSNKLISSRPPSVYLKDVAKAAEKNLDKWLDSNLISHEAYQAALKDDYESFLKLRAETIDSVINLKVTP